MNRLRRKPNTRPVEISMELGLARIIGSGDTRAIQLGFQVLF